jgi:hypothetical protein
MSSPLVLDTDVDLFLLKEAKPILRSPRMCELKGAIIFIFNLLGLCIMYYVLCVKEVRKQVIFDGVIQSF